MFACTKSQFHIIADLFAIAQLAAIDRYVVPLGLRQHDFSRRLERNNDFEGELFWERIDPSGLSELQRSQRVVAPRLTAHNHEGEFSLSSSL